MRVAAHQHIWTGPLLARLGACQTAPLVRHSNGLTMLHTAAEQPSGIDVTTEAAERRAEVVRRDGLDPALIAISRPLGIEALPRDSALDVIEAHLDGPAVLPASSRPGVRWRWAPPMPTRSIDC